MTITVWSGLVPPDLQVNPRPGTYLTFKPGARYWRATCDGCGYRSQEHRSQDLAIQDGHTHQCPKPFVEKPLRVGPIRDIPEYVPGKTDVDPNSGRNLT